MVEPNNKKNSGTGGASPEGNGLIGAKRVLEEAKQQYAIAKSWVEFYRATLGNSGVVRRVFNAPEQRAKFERTAEYRQIIAWLNDLRERRSTSTDTEEPTRVITVRLPKSMHEQLRKEAHEHLTSLNQLCITKLVEPTFKCDI
jgi:hypothetical protein